MTHHKPFNHESQDARRHDQAHATHPNEKPCKTANKSGKTQGGCSSSHPNKRK